MGCSVSKVQPIVVDARDAAAVDSATLLQLANSTVGCTSSDTRRTLWHKLLAPANLDDKEQKIEFERLEAAVKSVDVEHLRIIDCDITRTDRNRDEWRDPSALEPLRRILAAHLARSPEIGYYQGMNDIAAVIWTAIPELPRAFFYFSAWVDMHRLNWLPALKGVWQQASVILAVLQVVDAPLAAQLAEYSFPGQPLPFLFQPIFLRLKREMKSYEETKQLWEVCWAARMAKPNGDHYDLLCIAALVLSQRRKLLRREALPSMEGLAMVKQVFSDLRGTQRAKPLLSRAHSLFEMSAVRTALKLDDDSKTERDIQSKHISHI